MNFSILRRVKIIFKTPENGEKSQSLKCPTAKKGTFMPLKKKFVNPIDGIQGPSGGLKIIFSIFR